MSSTWLGYMGRMGALMALGLFNTGCSDGRDGRSEEEQWAQERREMVDVLILAYQFRDPRILAAMGTIRRHEFIPERFRQHGQAYGDHPLPIGYDQTISQPFIVAYMTEKLALKPGETVLEIGTGSGYQAAVLAEMGARVFSIEIVPELAQHAREVLAREGYTNNVQILTTDGHQGWREHAPFDAIIGTCAPTAVPEALVEQLKDGGRIILPVGEWMAKRLVILRKSNNHVVQMDDLPVRFVPMIKRK